MNYRDYMYLVPTDLQQFAEMVHAAGTEAKWEHAYHLLKDYCSQICIGEMFRTAPEIGTAGVVAVLTEDTQQIYLKMAFSDRIATLWGEEALEMRAKMNRDYNNLRGAQLSAMVSSSNLAQTTRQQFGNAQAQGICQNYNQGITQKLMGL